MRHRKIKIKLVLKISTRVKFEPKQFTPL